MKKEKQVIKRLSKTAQATKAVMLRLTPKTYAALKKISIDRSLSMNAIVSEMITTVLK